MEFQELREGISKLDNEIVKLLEKRFNLVIEVGKYKKERDLPVYDEAREKTVIERCKNQLNNSEFSEQIENIYTQIMDSCKDIQKNL